MIHGCLCVLHILRAVFELLPANRVHEIVTNYEAAVWRTVKEDYPHMHMRGCFFHNTQVVWRKVQDLGIRSFLIAEGQHYLLSYEMKLFKARICVHLTLRRTMAIGQGFCARNTFTFVFENYFKIVLFNRDVNDAYLWAIDEQAWLRHTCRNHVFTHKSGDLRRYHCCHPITCDRHSKNCLARHQRN
jgi:hypothetical protein